MGKAQYAADIDLPGMLQGKILRSPHAHAEIISIDVSRAESHPDVQAVITNSNFPSYEHDLKQQTDNIMASDKVLYKGHAVAAVAASSVHAAEEALALIDVEYKPLAPITNDEDALKDGAPLLHKQYENNITSHSQLKLGNIDTGFKNADHIVERQFRTSTVHQGYIEPHSATGWWTANDKVTIWGSSQGHFQIRDKTADVLGIPHSTIKAIPLEIGGGFGGKTTIYLEPVAAMLSKESGAPV